MSKGYLLVEMPKECVNCELCEIIPSGDYGYTEYFCNIKDEQIKDTTAEKKKPSWCPLRPMPEKYNSSYDTDYGVGYIRGWNDCIKAIEGSGE